VDTLATRIVVLTFILFAVCGTHNLHAELQADQGIFNTSIRFRYSGQVPSSIRSAFSGAAQGWNSCNNGQDDFPMLYTASPGGVDVPVRFIFGRSEQFIQNMTGQSGIGTCAFTSTLDHPAGAGDEVFFFELAEIDGEIMECYPQALPEIARDAAAHEMGHILGSGHPNCSIPFGIPVMTSRQFSAGQFYDTSRRRLSVECALVDAVSSTPAEAQNECEQGDPDCDQEWSPFSPILLDLHGDGWRFSGLSDPIAFDIDADGTHEFIGWVERGNQDDVFLALDRNGNGVIDDGSELFGNATPLINGGVAVNGYQALAEFDHPDNGGDHDGSIDPGDSIWPRLLLWADVNHDATTDPGELVSLAMRGVVKIGTNFTESTKLDPHGNMLRFKGRAWLLGKRGHTREIETVDVFFIGSEPN